MVKVQTKQTNWSSGEISSDLTRSDIERYYNACSKLRNFIVTEKGSLRRRTGFKNVLSVDLSGILIPPIIKAFVFSDQNRYIIEFGENYLRVIKNDIVQNIGVDNKIYSPFTVSQIKSAGFAQSNDVIFITHSVVGIKKLIRSSDTSWSFSDFDPQDGPFLDSNIREDITIHNTKKQGTTTVKGQFTAAVPAGYGAFFDNNDIGRLVRIQHKGVWGCAKITDVDSPLTARYVNQDGYNYNNEGVSQYRWKLGAWTNFLGWPSKLCFHKERLVFGGTPSYPDQLVQSVIGDFDTFSTTVPDLEIEKNNYNVKYSNPANDYSVEYDSKKHIVTQDTSIVSYLTADSVPIIKSLKSFDQGLFVGTSGGIFVVTGGSPREAQSNDNIDIKYISTTPVSEIDPLLVKNTLVFVDSSKRRVKSFDYDFNTNSFKEVDLTLLSHHLFDSNIKQIVYQKKPDSIIWCLLESGEIVGITFNPDEKIVSCHKHFIGHENQNDSYALIQSITILEQINSLNDDLYIVLKRRNISGGTTTTIQKLSEHNRQESHSNIYLDSFKLYSSISSPIDISDSNYNLVGVNKVFKNSIDEFYFEYGLNFPYTNVETGYKYKSELQSLPLDYIFSGQSMVSKKKKIAEANIYFDGVLGGYLGTLSKQYPLLFNKTSDLLNNVLPIFFGQKTIKMKTGNEKTISYKYFIEDPYRCDIIYVDISMEIYV